MVEKIIVREFMETDRKTIMNMMVEFGMYLKKIDPLGRIDYPEGGDTFFTDKLIKNVQNHKGKIFVAEDQGVIVGFIGGFVGAMDDEESKITKNKKTGIVDEFFVTQKYRGKRIGKRLMQEMEKYLKTIGCDMVRIEVFAPNTNALQFYEKQGYIKRTIYVNKRLM